MNKTLKEFFEYATTAFLSNLEIYNYIKLNTNDFDKKSLDYFFEGLEHFFDYMGLKFYDDAEFMGELYKKNSRICFGDLQNIFSNSNKQDLLEIYSLLKNIRDKYDFMVDYTDIWRFVNIERVEMAVQIYDIAIQEYKPNPNSTEPTKPFDLSDENLLKQLTPYIKNCSVVDLETIIEHKRLPIGRDLILWTGAKADAIRFIEHFKITKAQFMKMFYFADNIKLHEKHRDKNGTPSDLSDILKNYPI